MKFLLIIVAQVWAEESTWFQLFSEIIQDDKYQDKVVPLDDQDHF